MVKVLIVDDSSFMRVKIKTSIEKYPDIKVVGIARNGIEALNKTVLLRPDVITMDINMPDMSGIAAVEKIMQYCPTPIIMISSLTYKGSSETLSALEKGAFDYIFKDDMSDDVLIEKILLAAQAYITLNPGNQQNNILDKKHAVENRSFSIIGIGISTGGPQALVSLMPQISPEISAGIIIAQHMPPIFTKSLADRLNEISSVRVAEAAENDQVLPGHVYICPGGMHISVDSAGTIHLHPKDYYTKHYYVPSVDLLMSSIGAAYGSSALCIIMTGMGSDGLAGIREAKENGSYVIAQSEASSTIFGMPKAIISNSLQDETVHLSDMSDRINQLCTKD